jgi:drug/metabolite transporter (DMT)-like permease
VPIYVAIALTLTASTIMNLGLVLQKKGVTEIAARPQAGQRGRIRKYLRSGTWRWGMALLVVGYGLFMAASFARAAPISLLQPIFAFGVVVVALMAVLYLKERFGAVEWLGVVLLVAGVVLLGASAEEGRREDARVYLPYLLIYLAGAAALIAAGILMIKFFHRRINTEVLYGILAGTLLGVGYLNTKTFALAWKTERWGVAAFGLVMLLVGLFGGLVVLQKGFRRGRALIVTAVNLVVNQVAVVAGGLLCLGEKFPKDPTHFYERVVGLAAILCGTVILARFSSGEVLAVVESPEVPQASTHSAA